jgi:hypothetical protein
VTAKNYFQVEDLEVYNKLCRLHIEICDLTHTWPQEEKYELGSQAGVRQTVHLLNLPRKTMIGISAIKLKV